ncbi:MAG: hypothetical protein ACUVT0_06970 [Thermochromatium sp.]
MDSAYEGDATRELAQQLGFAPVVLPNAQRKQPLVIGQVTLSAAQQGRTAVSPVQGLAPCVHPL